MMDKKCDVGVEEAQLQSALPGSNSAKNLLTGSIKADAPFQCLGLRFPILTNLISTTTTLLPSIKNPHWLS